MQIKKRQFKKGTSLVETLVYVSLLALLTGVTITGLLTLNNSLQGVVMGRIIDDTAQEVMEKIIREIRFADSVDTVNSTLGVSPSVLVLDSTTVLGAPTEVEFSISSGVLEFKRDGTVVGPLTAAQVTINELLFDHIVTPESEAVKVSLVLFGARAKVTVEESFSTTVILRSSY